MTSDWRQSVLAARRRRELLALTGMFLLGLILACIVSPSVGWQPAPRFVEAAAALTIAYLAAEILLLPEAGKRWLVVGALGVFHGFYFDLFIRGSEYGAGYVLTGVAVSEVLLVALFALIFLVSGPLIRLIVALTRSAQRVAEGDYSEGGIPEVRGTLRDEITTLAAVFCQMVAQIAHREEELKDHVKELTMHIQIDQLKKAKKVAEITETEYFLQLQEKARKMREARSK